MQVASLSAKLDAAVSNVTESLSTSHRGLQRKVDGTREELDKAKSELVARQAAAIDELDGKLSATKLELQGQVDGNRECIAEAKAEISTSLQQALDAIELARANGSAQVVFRPRMHLCVFLGWQHVKTPCGS